MSKRASGMPPFRSELTGLAWPALLKGLAAQLAATLYQFEDSQWWSREETTRAQRPQLLGLLAHAIGTVPYYRRYNTLGKVEALLEAWSEVPILTRAALQQAGKTLFSTAIPKEHGAVQIVRTSGSTGRPVEALSTAVTRFFWNAFTLREHLWHDRDFRGKLVAIRPDRKSVASGTGGATWGPPVDLLFQTGPSALLHSSTAISAQADWLRAQQPSYLLSLPANLQALAEEFRAGGTSLPSLKQVRSYGETVRPKLRRLVEETWGVPVTDVYSSQEAGYIALQCPENEQYHLQSEHLLVEIVDDAGLTCKPGEIGRVLLTTLHNFASPLIRYEIGDYAEVGEPCSCGRGLPVIRRVLGRERNLVVLPNGERHWPSFPEERWMAVAPIRQLQLVQKTTERIEVRLSAPRELTPQEQTTLGEIFAVSLGYPFQLDFTYMKEIPRGANGKFEDFLCEAPVAGSASEEQS